MIKIEELNVSRNGEHVLRNVSLEVGTGERVLLMGPNGSGKTSLARVIMGDESYEVASGSVEFMGEDILSASIHERARRGIFVSFQDPVEVPGVSSYEFLFAAYREVHTGEKLIEVDDFEKMLLDAADVLGVEKNLLSRGVNEGFSGGEKKKLELIQMLVLDPKFVVLDEPDSGLDADSVKLVGKALDSLPDESGILLISHDPARLGMKSYDRVFVMKDGEISKEGGEELIEGVSEKGYE